jgi:hypothetical protein
MASQHLCHADTDCEVEYRRMSTAFKLVPPARPADPAAAARPAASTLRTRKHKRRKKEFRA